MQIYKITVKNVQIYTLLEDVEHFKGKIYKIGVFLYFVKVYRMLLHFQFYTTIF